MIPSYFIYKKEWKHLRIEHSRTLLIVHTQMMVHSLDTYTILSFLPLISALTCYYRAFSLMERVKGILERERETIKGMISSVCLQSVCLCVYCSREFVLSLSLLSFLCFIRFILSYLSLSKLSYFIKKRMQLLQEKFLLSSNKFYPRPCSLHISMYYTTVKKERETRNQEIKRGNFCHRGNLWSVRIEGESTVKKGVGRRKSVNRDEENVQGKELHPSVPSLSSWALNSFLTLLKLYSFPRLLPLLL